MTTPAGIDLFYVEAVGRIGIHQAGIARILDCDRKTVSNASRVANPEYMFEAVIETAGGIQVAKLVNNKGFADVLSRISRGRYKKATRDRAVQRGKVSVF